MVTDRVDEAVLEHCPSLRVVANVAAGYDNFDVPALTRRRIPAGNTPGVLTNSTADMAFALLLSCARRVVEGRDAVLAGEWTVWDPALMLGLELSGSTLGIVGMGRIGQAVAKRALAFSMRVIATSRTERPVEGVTYVDLETLLRESDVISLHVALSEATRHLISVDELAAMKPSAILINTARGAVVDQVALAAALADGTIGGAGLDVFEREPLDLDDPLLSAPNCICVPHIAASTFATRNAMGHLAADNIIAGLSGEPLPHCINPEVYER
jgi:glyoxylate reductase